MTTATDQLNTRGPNYRRHIDHSPVADATSDQLDAQRAAAQGFNDKINRSRSSAMVARQRHDADKRLHQGYCQLCNGTGNGRANWQTVTYTDDTLGWNVDGTRKPAHLIPLDYETELDIWYQANHTHLPHSSPLASTADLHQHLDDESDDGDSPWEAALHLYMLKDGADIQTMETEAAAIAYCLKCTGTGLNPGWDYPRWLDTNLVMQTTAPRIYPPKYELDPDQRAYINARKAFRARVNKLQQEREQYHITWEKPFSTPAR